MSSWAEPQYESYPNQPYLHPLDVPDGSIREAEHPPSLVTGYSYTPRPSPNSSRQTYSSGLYGPRPQPSHPEPIQGLPTPAMVPRAMSDLEEEADDEYMEVEPMADSGVPIYSSEFDDEPRSQGRRRFVGGFMRGLKKIPKAVKRGFSPHKRELPTPPGLAYYESPYRSPYIDDIEPQESEAAPPYDAPSDHVEGDLRYTDGVNMPAEFTSPSPSLTPSQTIHAPRSESQLTYQSVTNPPARHVSQHGSLHHAQRSSPPRMVRNPDPTSPTDDSGTANAHSPRYEQPPLESEPDSAYRTPHRSPLAPARRPTVMVQSPTGSPVYFEPPPSDDYAGMDMDALTDHSPEPSVPTQLSRVARFMRDLKNLPWVSPNVTVDFDPADAERARYAHTQGAGKSWYTGHLQDLDLLAGGSNTRRLTTPSGHAFGPAPGSSATLAPLHHESGSASNSSEGASAHLPTAPPLPPYPYPVQTLALPPHPLYYYPFPGMPQLQQQQQQQQQQPQPQPMMHAPEQVSLQSSGNSDIPKQQPFLYVVAMPPGYPTGPMDPSQPMHPTFGGVPYPPPV
jgi:hypothetical protein